jgi:hypothetical protein
MTLLQAAVSATTNEFYLSVVLITETFDESGVKSEGQDGEPDPQCQGQLKVPLRCSISLTLPQMKG